jgi:hypothetical protein
MGWRIRREVAEAKKVPDPFILPEHGFGSGGGIFSESE